MVSSLVRLLINIAGMDMLLQKSRLYKGETNVFSGMSSVEMGRGRAHGSSELLSLAALVRAGCARTCTRFPGPA